MYEYKAVVLKIVDGDTVDVEIDLGLDVKIKTRLRLYGINAPERFTEEGKKVIERLESLIPAGTEIFVKTIKDKKEKYGRYLGIIYAGDLCINDLLVNEGLAVKIDY